ncbi:MAG: hypothetical protein JXA08_02515 [Methanomicrobiaceae archaeon]|nr:hypothetical protein [Methanomicrobiaceae archaeon]
MDIAMGLPALPERSVILVEEETGSIKTIFALMKAAEASGAGKKVRYITPGGVDDLQAYLDACHLTIPDGCELIGGITERRDMVMECVGDLCIIDRFGTFFFDSSLTELKIALDLFTEMSANGTIVLLIDRGLLPSRHEQMMRAMADGIIQFIATFEGNRVKRFIYVPKMRGRIPADRMVAFDLTDEGILVDTRERHG